MSPSIDAPSSTDRSSVTQTLSKTLSRTSTSVSVPAKGALEYGYPHGHIGHLTADELSTFEAFKALLAKHDLYTPSSPPSHDDATLLRYLRARRWDLPSAQKQFADTEAWRKQIAIDNLYDTVDVDAYEASRCLYPQWTGRRDRRGIPVYLYEIRHLDPKTISQHEKAAAGGGAAGKLGNLFALYENLTRFVQPLCTQLTDREYAGRTPITLSTNIVDVSGVSLRGYWNLKGHMQAASELATAHYPETLDRIFIIGAPAFFSTVWSWIKRWFDPVTVSKIFVLSAAETLPTLKSFIATENIPKQYGGELDFGWNDPPRFDAAIPNTVTWEDGYTGFPPGPLYWVPAPATPADNGVKRLQCVARGTVDGKARSEIVASIPVAEERTGNDADAAAGDEEKVDEQPVVVNGAVVAAADVASPTSEEFVDAPEEPGIQNLSLEDTNEKTIEVATEAAPNGKPVATV